jgi:hypothetical protein
MRLARPVPTRRSWPAHHGRALRVLGARGAVEPEALRPVRDNPASPTAANAASEIDLLYARRQALGFKVCSGNPKLPARADTELAEHVAQVPLDGAAAEEELRPDLRVGHSIGGEACDLLLLRG